MRRRNFNFLLLATWAVATWAGALATPALAQTGAIPDFSGIWTHPSLGFESPVSGPGPVVNKSRLPNGASNFDKLVGDYQAAIKLARTASLAP